MSPATNRARLGRAALSVLVATAWLGGCLSKSMVRTNPVATAARAEAAATPAATPEAAYPQARPLEERKPVVIKSRRLKYNNRRQETVFLGGVTVRQDSIVLTTDELTARAKGGEAWAKGHVEVVDPQRRVKLKSGQAHYGDELKFADLKDDVRMNTVDPYGRPVTVTSDEALYYTREQKATLTGQVVVLRQDITATAERADYDGEAGLITLSRGARVKKGSNRFKAETIEFRNKENRINMQGHVQAVFIPEEIENAAGRR